MGDGRSWASTTLNFALFVFGVGMIILLYSFISGTIWPETSTPPEDREEHEVEQRILQVDVRNGAGVSGIARETTSYLRSAGFDVVESGNYTSFDVEQSFVLDRAGDKQAAQRVANAIGIHEEQIEEEIRPEFYLDATIVIGHDYESLSPFQEE